MKNKSRKFHTDLLPLILLFGVLPWVVHLKTVETPLTQFAWFPQQSTQYDFFLYWKGILFLALTVWMLAALADRIIIRGKRRFAWRRFLPLGAYAALTAVSAVLSVHPALSLHGSWEQFETVWVLLGYVVAVFYANHVVETETDAKILLAAVLAGAAVQAALGILQFAGLDFFGSSAGKSLILSGYDPALKEGLNFGFADSQLNRVYMASHNPNYAGVYIVLVLPLACLAAWKAESRAWRIGGAVLTGALLICLWGSGSKSGLFAALLILFFGAVLLTGGRRRRLAVVFAGIAAAVLLGAAYNEVSGHALTDALRKAFSKVDAYKMEDVIPLEDCVELHYRGRVIRLSVREQQGRIVLKARDENGEKIKKRWKEKKQRWVLEQPEFYDIGFGAWRQEDADILVIYCNRSQFTFVRPQGGAYTYVNAYGRADTIERAESMAFNGFEKALTGRGYIWGRTLPLAAQHFLLGSGPDTFAAVFPQDDYLMRANTGPAMYRQIVSKPHNMYLQSAVLTGGLSLLCLLVFWGSYIRDFLKDWKQRRTAGSRAIMQLGIFLGICGYLVMGFLNDSTLAVAPVFWGMLGVGMAVRDFSPEK